MFTWATVKFFIIDHWKKIAIALGAVLILVWILSAAFCGGDMPAKIDEGNLTNTKEDIGNREREKTENAVNKITAPVVEANAKIAEAAANTERVANQNFNNTNMNAAREAQCRAYPERCK